MEAPQELAMGRYVNGTQKVSLFPDDPNTSHNHGNSSYSPRKSITTSKDNRNWTAKYEPVTGERKDPRTRCSLWGRDLTAVPPRLPHSSSSQRSGPPICWLDCTWVATGTRPVYDPASSKHGAAELRQFLQYIYLSNKHKS